MTQKELDEIPEMGRFKREPVPDKPGCYMARREPVYLMIGSDLSMARLKVQ